MVVERISKSHFKARALEYLRKVEKTGEPLVVMDRGRPVVKVVPYRGEAEEILRILRGSARRYVDPTRPVAVDAWEALR
jgi:prevent-host-death family protein